jgi:hypothetical protein
MKREDIYLLLDNNRFFMKKRILYSRQKSKQQTNMTKQNCWITYCKHDTVKSAAIPRSKENSKA